MDFESYQNALRAEPFSEYTVESILDEFFHSGIPHVFNGDAAAHGQFRRSLANEINSAFGITACHPHHVVICGSAHLGYSPVPEKLGKRFDGDTSDIDVAILLPDLFDRWWLELVDPRVSLGSHRSTIADDLLNGFINPHFVRTATTTGQKWWTLFGGFTTGGFNRVRGRIYRGPAFMQNYHRLSVMRGRESLLARRDY